MASVYTPIFYAPADLSAPNRRRLDALSKQHLALAQPFPDVPPSPTLSPDPAGRTAAVRAALAVADHNPAHGKWVHLSRLLRLPSTAGRTRWLGSRTDTTPPLDVGAVLGVSSGRPTNPRGLGWCNASNEGEWARWETQFTHEVSLKQRVVEWTKAVEPAVPINDPLASSSNSLGFTAAKRTSAAAALRTVKKQPSFPSFSNSQIVTSTPRKPPAKPSPPPIRTTPIRSPPNPKPSSQAKPLRKSSQPSKGPSTFTFLYGTGPTSPTRTRTVVPTTPQLNLKRKFSFGDRGLLTPNKRPRDAVSPHAHAAAALPTLTDLLASAKKDRAMKRKSRKSLGTSGRRKSGAVLSENVLLISPVRPNARVEVGIPGLGGSLSSPVAAAASLPPPPLPPPTENPDPGNDLAEAPAPINLTPPPAGEASFNLSFNLDLTPQANLDIYNDPSSSLFDPLLHDPDHGIDPDNNNRENHPTDDFYVPGLDPNPHPHPAFSTYAPSDGGEDPFALDLDLASPAKSLSSLAGSDSESSDEDDDGGGLGGLDVGGLGLGGNGKAGGEIIFDPPFMSTQKDERGTFMTSSSADIFGYGASPQKAPGFASLLTPPVKSYSQTPGTQSQTMKRGGSSYGRYNSQFDVQKRVEAVERLLERDLDVRVGEEEVVRLVPQEEGEDEDREGEDRVFERYIDGGALQGGV